MGIFQRTRQKLGVVGELFEFLWARKLWWIAPMVIVLVLFGALLLLTQGSALAPFVYTLF